MPEKIEPKDAMECLSILDYLIKRTHNKTIDKTWIDTMMVINNIFYNLYKKNFNPGSINNMKYIIDYISYTGIEKFIFVV